MKLIPTSNALSTHASAWSPPTPPPYVSHEPRLISETWRSLDPSWRYRIGPTVSVSVSVVPQFDAIGIVSSDLARSIAFYKLLGIEFPEEEGHIEATLPNGTRLMLDGEDVIRSFRPDWKRETGNQLALAFACSSPAEVD